MFLILVIFDTIFIDSVITFLILDNLSLNDCIDTDSDTNFLSV